MSYDEVERGLPPVNVVYSPLHTSRGARLPKFLSNDDDEDENYDRPVPKGNKTNSARPTDRKKETDMSIFTATSKSERPNSFNENSVTTAENEMDSISRSRRYGGFVLILLPPIFFALAVQFLKFMMADFEVYVLAMCIFQGILWPALFYLVYLMLTERKSVLGSIRCSAEGSRNLIELLILGIISSTAIIFQILSLQLLDITVSLAITFSPLIIAALILHIHQEQQFPPELSVTTIVAYIGVTLIAIPAIIENDPKLQEQMIVGVGASVSSMLLTIPAALQISRLRRKQINDCLTATFLGVIGTVLSVVAGVVINTWMTRKPFSEVDTNPWKIAGLVALVFAGTLFQIFEANYRKAQRRAANLSRIRVGVFILSGIWEILKHGFVPGQFFYPSVFSIFGVLLIMLSYLFTVSYRIWFEEKKRKKASEKKCENDLYFIPWLFSDK